MPELKTKHWQLGVIPNMPDSKDAAKTVTETFASQSLDYWQQAFATADVCVTPVLTLEEARAHPLFAHQDEHQATSGWQLIG